MVILHVNLEVLREVRDALRQQSDLHLGRAGITWFSGEFLYDLCFSFRYESHPGCLPICRLRALPTTGFVLENRVNLSEKRV